MLKNKLLTAFIASLFIVFFSYNPMARSEEVQEEEAFSEPIQ
ncbi:MAG: hypothetical protein PHD43_05075 [Methylococcales bacterium]|nr:hypothetical protein [Methylococcales bacterium]